MRILLFILIFILSNVDMYSFEKASFVNYMNISLTQGFYMPSNSDDFGGSNISSSFGFLYDIDAKNSVVGVYNLNYNGPSLYEGREREFNERSISSGFSVEWRRKINNYFRLRPSVSYRKNYFKSSGTSDFDDNIYNNTDKGFDIAMDYYLNANIDRILSFVFFYRKIEFPNYTDLLLEFRNPGVQSETYGGLYDNGLYGFSLKYKYFNYFFASDIVFQNYNNQRVLKNDGTYSNTFQKDREFKLKVGIEEKWREYYYLYPSLEFIIHNSNQNFLRFKSITDISPVFVDDAYSYNQININLPVNFEFKKYSVDPFIKYSYKKYKSRWPRDSDNNYMYNKKQYNNIFTLGCSFSRKLNNFASVVFGYYFTYSGSNNKFEYYIPYNYTSNNFYITFKVEY